MKSIKWLHCFTIILFLLGSNELMGQITASVDSGCAPLVGVEFGSPNNASNINWDFDDGASANVPNPVHTFVEPGTYTVVYMATVGGSDVSEQLTINVFPNPNASFLTENERMICAGTSVNFQGIAEGGGGTDIVSWAWSFGDGNTDQTNNPNPSNVYEIPGAFDVTLTVEDANGCDSTYTLQDYILVSEPPNVNFSSNPSGTAFCAAPVTMDFSAAGSMSNSPFGDELTYNWDFGDGTGSTQADPGPITYTENGSYTVVLTVSDDIGCSTVLQRVININEPLADFTAEGAVNDTVCNEVQFQNLSSGGNYQWNFGDGTISFDENPIHFYGNPGPYDVTLTVTAGPCQADTTMTIYVQEVFADFAMEPSYSCELPYQIQFTDQSINASSWLWEFSNGDSSFVQNPVLTIDSIGGDEYTIYDPLYLPQTLTITSSLGCTDTRTLITDTLFLPTARFIPSVAQGCAPLTVSFEDKSISNETIVTWFYDFGDGTTQTYTSPDDIPEHTFEEAGEYEVILVITNDKGCMDTSYVQPISVGVPSEDIMFVLDTQQVCPRDTVSFTNLTPLADSIDVWHYEADGGHMSHCPTDSLISWVFENEYGSQDISLTVGYNGCLSSDTIEDIIEVLGPMGFINYECTCDTPMVYHFDADIRDGEYWTWDLGDSTIFADTTVLDLTHTYAESGDYWVKLTVTDTNSVCNAFVDSVLIKVRNIQAAFEVDSLVCVGDSVEFDASASVDVHEYCHRGYQWYFDDGEAPYTTEKPTIKYAFRGSGNHEVRLVVTDENACTDTTFYTVRAFRVDALFETDVLTDCIMPDPLGIQFTDLSVGDTTLASWMWDFGDGGMSMEQNPFHEFSLPPAGGDTAGYTVNLTVLDVLNCPGSYSFTIFPIIPEVAFNATSNRFICAGDEVSFAPANPNFSSYTWDFGDGSDSVTGMNPSHAFTEPGLYDITLTIVDENGCENNLVREAYVSVQAYPDAEFVSDADDLEHKCYPLLINYESTSTGDDLTYDWNLGNGNPVVGEPIVGTIYEAPGEYEVSLVATTSFGCQDSISKPLLIEGPIADFELDPDLICRGDAITFNITDTMDVWAFSWDFGDGFDTTDVSPVTHVYDISPGSGETFASLVYWSPDSACSASTTQRINFYNVFADFDRNNESAAIDTMHCIGTPDLFTNTSVNADSWVWDFGDGTTSTQQNPGPYTYNQPGEYQVSLSISDDETGCTDIISKTMIITEEANIEVEDAGACEGELVQLMATGGTNFQWSPPTGLSDPNSPNPIADIDSTMEYIVTITDFGGCTDTAKVLAIIYQEIEPINIDTFLIIGETVQLNAFGGPGLEYDWSPSSGLSCDDCPSPIITAMSNVNYTVNVRDPEGCHSATSRFNIEVDRKSSIDVPSAFTPNGDGINDVIFVDGWGIRDLVEFKIFNRYGQLIYESNDLEEGWDGYFEGKLQNSETYVYTATVTTWLNETLSKNGSFNLLK